MLEARVAFCKVIYLGMEGWLRIHLPTWPLHVGRRGVHVDVDACMGKKVTSSFVRFPLREGREGGTIVLGTGPSVIHL